MSGTEDGGARGASGPGSLSATRAEELDRVCDRFEAAWRVGERPNLAAYLAGVEGSERAVLVRELIAVDVHWRERTGERLTAEEYLARFPGDAEAIRLAFGPDSPSDGTSKVTRAGEEADPFFRNRVDGARPPIEGWSGSLEETKCLPAREGARPPALGSSRSESCEPSRIGRYRIIQRLGQGGFGRVYLAHDDDLDRPVAIKVPNPERIARAEDAEAFLVEARVLAKLDHPHIVPVHDVGRTEDGLCFIVSKLVEGSDLADRIGQDRPSFRDAAELVATIAEALHYAHTHGLVHRDIKPANILIDISGKPCIADFGLALRDEDFGKGGGLAGTPAYMSPEQARGEGHLVDGRSDIFSLGVVFYELLTGRRPFRAESLPALIEQVTQAEARPPRQIDDTIPRELERICQKALSKRASERHSTAKDMAEDLRAFLQSTGGAGSPLAPAVPVVPPGSALEAAPLPSTSRPSDSDQRPIRIVPKGLRSFDQQDADFFLELLPGPRDRDGLPESIRFWKGKIEQIDPDLTFRVGVIYGPSGCGKSSLVKAGLLPRLGQHAYPVYVEATADETEARLLKGVRRACPGLPRGVGLVDSLVQLRRGRILPPERKVLLVLDQFEQWLHAKLGEENTELVAALRQCDGEHVQAVVMVRDDFWMAVTRFMDALEVELLKGQNTAAVDLFDPRHARKVLMAFGTAYGNLPERTSELSRDQHAFLDQATSELAQDGKVVSVRLAVFAEMVKGRPWTPASLRAVGGTEGVGVTFLEETFASAQANPRHRLHQKAAQSVLKALLPESGTTIKGQMRSEPELREAAEYVSRPRDFADLLHILDSELRLITPTDLEGSGDGPATGSPGGRHYQLTHDYLVPALRTWLTRKQKETRRGRAELRLAERAALWSARPENRRLPSVWEWATIRLLTRTKHWTEPQRRMMKRARRVHGLRTLGVAALIALLTWGGIEAYGNLHASALAESLRTASTTGVPALIDQLRSCRRWAGRPLARLLSSTEPDSGPHLRASLASLALFPEDRTQADYLYDRLLVASPVDLPVIWDILRKHHPGIEQRLWALLDDPKSEGEPRFRAACALAGTDSARGGKSWDSVAPFIADRFLTTVIKNPSDYATLIETLRPLRKRLLTPLASIFRDTGRSETERNFATTILADYASDDPEVLTDLLMDAGPRAYAGLFPVIKRQASQALPLLREITRSSAREQAESEEVKDRLAERQARAAIALVRLGHADEVWPLLQHSPDPRLRSFIVNWVSPLGADPKMLAAELARLDSYPRPAERGEGARRAGEGSSMDAILFHPETSIRRALILALGTYGSDTLSPDERDSLIPKLLDLYCNDCDAGIHGAAEWTLRQWKQQAKVDEIERNPRRQGRGDRRWYVNGQGQTFVLVEGRVEFRIGSPPQEPERDPHETPHRRDIPWRFAIATKEVTVAQYQKFERENPQFGHAKSFLDKYSPERNGAMIGVSWFGAAAYCNWLSKQEGLPEDQWCYLPNERAEYAKGMTIPADALRRTGYRLPTEAEWEYACRAGAGTSRYYGLSIDLLKAYARYQPNSQDHACVCGTLLPNDLGLSDMLGNAWEWCQERWTDYQPGRADSPIDNIIDDSHRLIRGGSFTRPPSSIRSADRYGGAPSMGIFNEGFRPARTYN